MTANTGTAPLTLEQQERAAIAEFDGGLSRAAAEALARQETRPGACAVPRCACAACVTAGRASVLG